LHEHRATAAAQAGASNPSAILAAVDAKTLKQLSMLYPKIPIFNLTLEDDTLRARCLPNVLHVIPSQRMRQEAMAQWRKLYPEAHVTAQAWHPEFEKYAAKQLNRAIARLRIGRWMIGLGPAGPLSRCSLTA
jgi:hypothetical protein